MTAMFEVQKGVPIPEVDRTPKGVRRKYPIEGMAEGDMFFVPDRSAKSVSAYISRIAKSVTGTFSARHCWMVQNDNKWTLAKATDAGAVEGTGVWRLSEAEVLAAQERVAASRQRSIERAERKAAAAARPRKGTKRVPRKPKPPAP